MTESYKYMYQLQPGEVELRHIFFRLFKYYVVRILEVWK